MKHGGVISAAEARAVMDWQGTRAHKLPCLCAYVYSHHTRQTQHYVGMSSSEAVFNFANMEHILSGQSGAAIESSSSQELYKGWH